MYLFLSGSKTRKQRIDEAQLFVQVLSSSKSARERCPGWDSETVFLIDS